MAAEITLVFTDIENSTRLWEQDPSRMRLAVARHYEVTKAVFERHGGAIDTTTGDGALSVFSDAVAAVRAAVELQVELARAATDMGLTLRLRCAVHVSRDERHGQIFFGQEANRAARIMGAAHGGQILVSGATSDAVRGRLPRGIGLLNCGHVRLRDLASAEHVYQVTCADLQREFPPLRGLAGTPNNIPLQLTPLIGREHALAQARELLSTGRLLTLQGAGGIGKTRLALQVAADELEQYPDGVWFVDLSPVGDPSLVGNTIASVLHAQQDANQEVMNAVQEHLRDRKTLLLLDNCEHLIERAARAAEQILGASPQVKIIATSREPLRVPGEISYVVPPLGVPRAEGAPDLAAILACEGVQCFVEWARRAQPSFRVTAENANAVAEICRRLDGIPLALELAAARLSSLPISTIAARLSDRFTLLSRGARTALPRQQTLRALIAWSHDLLLEREKAAFRCLAAFAGSFSIEAAEAVLCAPGGSTQDVVEVVTSLVDKSLLVFDQDSGRYRMLDTIREFAREKLNDAPDEKQCRERLVQFAVHLSTQARVGLVGPEQGSWVKQLDLERDNLQLAQNICDQLAGGADLGVELADNIKLYWYKRGQLELGLRFVEQALTRLDRVQDPQKRSRALFNAGQFCSYMGRYRDAQTYLRESVRIAREIGNKGATASALLPLGLAALGEGDLALAEACFLEALALTRALGAKRDIASAATQLATVRRLQGGLDAARSLYDEVAVIARELNDQDSVAIALLNLAIIAIDCAQSAKARTLLLEACKIARATQSRALGQSAVEIAAALAASCGDAEVAGRLFGAAEALANVSGIRRDAADDAFVNHHIGKIRSQAPHRFGSAELEGKLLEYERVLREVSDYLAT